MGFPTLPEVRNDFSKVVKDLGSLIGTLSTRVRLSYSEYLTQRGNIEIELIKLKTKINGVITADAIKKSKETGSLKANRQYSKTLGDMEKILKKMLTDTDKIERKYLKDKFGFLFWEHVYEVGEMRKDLINHFIAVSKELTKIQKKI